MDTSNFVKVFDVADVGFREWAFSALPLIFVAFGLGVLAFRRIVRAAGIPNLNFKPDLFSRPWSVLPYFFVGFGVLTTAAVFSATYSTYLSNKELVEQNRCRVVEGPVQNFVPVAYAADAQESFSVAGVPFQYSDSVMQGGFNDTSSHGGPISSDSYVRICYDPPRNVILRLEIRDFKGELKDYSKQSVFPVMHDIRNAGDWPDDLLIVLFVLDVLVIRALYTPYLRALLRLEESPVRDCPIPASLIQGKKIKLRNNMVYWDAGTRTIWLRPRGMNLIKAPFTAGRLSTAPEGTSISGTEVLFSSAFPFIVVLDLAAWWMFSGEPSPAEPGGIVVVMTLVISLIYVRILWSRMAQLIDDAISEIRRM